MSNNATRVELTDGRVVGLSYGVPVAVFVPGRGWLKTDARYSTTTSRHMNQFVGGADNGTEVPEAELKTLVSPLATVRPQF
jgi:hypothetical protein